MSSDFDKPDKPFIPVPPGKDIGTYSRRPTGDSPPGTTPIPTGGGPIVFPPKPDKGNDQPSGPIIGGDDLII